MRDGREAVAAHLDYVATSVIYTVITCMLRLGFMKTHVSVLLGFAFTKVCNLVGA